MHANQCTILPSTVVNVPFDWSALQWYAVNDPPATIDREIENNLVFETLSFLTNPEW